jgi:hypothetical protein
MGLTAGILPVKLVQRQDHFAEQGFDHCTLR